MSEIATRQERCEETRKKTFGELIEGLTPKDFYKLALAIDSIKGYARMSGGILESIVDVIEQESWAR